MQLPPFFQYITSVGQDRPCKRRIVAEDMAEALRSSLWRFLWYSNTMGDGGACDSVEDCFQTSAGREWRMSHMSRRSLRCALVRPFSHGLVRAGPNRFYGLSSMFMVPMVLGDFRLSPSKRRTM